MDGLMTSSGQGGGGGGETAAAASAVNTPTKTTANTNAKNTSFGATAPITNTTTTTATTPTPTEDLLLLVPSASSTSSTSEVAAASTPRIIINPNTPSSRGGGGGGGGRADQSSPFSFSSKHLFQNEQQQDCSTTSSPSKTGSGADRGGRFVMTQQSVGRDTGDENHSVSSDDEEEEEEEGGYNSPLEEDFVAVPVMPAGRSTAADVDEFDPLCFPQSPPQSSWPSPQQQQQPQHQQHQPGHHTWGTSYYSPSHMPAAVTTVREDSDNVILDVLVPQASSLTPSLMSSTMETSSSSTRRRQQANSASRRRGGNANNATNTTTSNTTPSPSPSGLRRPRNNNNNTRPHDATDHSNSSSRTSSGGGSNSATGNNASSLRASLDAGMASVRRWLRSHSFSASTSLPSSSTTPTAAGSGGGQRGRSVTWVFENNNNDAASSSIESEDFFLNSIHGGSDENSTSHRNHHPHHHHQQQQQQQHYHHPTILEEDEDEEARGSARQRALSEPDVGRIRDWLFHHNRLTYSSSSTRRRRRRHRTYNRTFSESEVVVGLGSSSGGGRQLSSSAAAALHTQQQQQQQVGVGVALGMGTDLQQQQQQPIDLISSTNTLRVNTSMMMNDRSFADGGLDNIGGAAPGVSDNVVVEMTTIGGVGVVIGGGERVVVNNNNNNNNHHNVSTDSSGQRNRSPSPTANDRERRARIRWIRINRRFQLVITMVALLFSLLLFGILIGWVVLTSAYVVSFDKSCDLPLKPYFWLVTFQLVLDVFRNDIMRFVFNWDANSNLRIPFRVIVYNVAYLLYAFLVLRMGINSVVVESDTTCRATAPELFKATLAFVSLSIAAWTTIVCGYLLPFCIVAALLTYNGYNPSSSSAFEVENGTTQPVFPAAYSTTGAPTGTVEQLRVVVMENYPQDYPMECCICMEEFNSFDVVVETRCKHIFHKQCCREWLRQARTCPVCRTDIPSTLEDLSGNNRATSPTSVSSPTQAPPSGSRIPIGPTGRPVVGLFRMFHNSESFHSTGGGVGGSGSRSGSPVVAATPGGSQTHSLPAS